MTERASIVALATAWGPRFGGINAFNAELLKSLGIQSDRHFDLTCVIAGEATPALVAEGRRFGVELRGLGRASEKFDAASAGEIATLLEVTADSRRFLWLGHDDKTGPLALALRTLAPGSRAILLNHMAHGAYQSVKKGKSAPGVEKETMQRELFRQADLCLAVGPLLQDHLQDLLAGAASPPVAMLVPGLVDPAEYEVTVSDTTPNNFFAFVAGRLGAEDDRIKQGTLALRGFGRAVRDCQPSSVIRRSPKLRLRGVRPEEEETLGKLLNEEAKGAVAVDFQDFTEDRRAYFRDLAASSVALMPSWHEGFGLTAWEAIACSVPVIVSEESGVYRLLLGACSGIGLGQSVAHVRVHGWLPSIEEEANHTEADVDAVAEALLDFGMRAVEARQQAATLRRNLIDLKRDWKGCARTFLEAIETHLGVVLRWEPAPSPTPTAPAPVSADPDVPEWLRLPTRRGWRPELPTSLLLAARDEVVPFDPERDPVLQQLRDWATESDALAARLVSGPGGMGKTRLALELARTLEGEGWRSLWLTSSPPPDWQEKWGALLRRRHEQPLLLVIDYADGRQPELLAALAAMLDRSREAGVAPMRMLLLARGAAWLHDLEHHGDCPAELSSWLSAGVLSTLELPPWGESEKGRLASYQRALDGYAAAMGRAVPPHLYVPRLSESPFERPLYVHLAAVAALEGQRPESAEALLRDQLQREWGHWRTIHRQHSGLYDDWADALAYVVLRQGVPAHKLPEALAGLGIAADGLAKRLRQSYPAGTERVAALEPDLLAEALLRERLAERRGPVLLEATLGAAESEPPAAIPVIARLAARRTPFVLDEAPAWTRTLVSALARHWPAHPNAWMLAAHGGEYGLGDLLAAAWPEIEETMRATTADQLQLPEYSTHLLSLQVGVARERVASAPDRQTKAAALNNLAVHLAARGDAASRLDALVCGRESMGLYRGLAASQPAAYLPHLASSLNNLAIRLSEQGGAVCRLEALACGRESVAIRRQLAASQPAAYLPGLALSLVNLANRLSEQEDAASRLDALACVWESVGLYRELAGSQPTAYRPFLAMSLNNLAVYLAGRGDAASRLDALVCGRESVAILRELAASQPAAYLPDLALSLTNLAIRLSEQGDEASRLEALACGRQSVGLYQELVASQPAAYLPDLALSLNNLAELLGEQGDAASRLEALACARESVAIYARLQAFMPGVFARNLQIAADCLRQRARENGLDPEGEVAAAPRGDAGQ